MEYQKILDDINAELKRESFGGKVANYIPELAQVDPDKFGIHLSTLDNGDYFIGCNKERFSIQSISKVFALT
ncbi:MAG TPA: glutaminase, partial [Balneola sp.]|nr:glutaminase [Balneola sp.]